MFACPLCFQYRNICGYFPSLYHYQHLFLYHIHFVTTKTVACATLPSTHNVAPRFHCSPQKKALHNLRSSILFYLAPVRFHYISKKCSKKITVTSDKVLTIPPSPTHYLLPKLNGKKSQLKNSILLIWANDRAAHSYTPTHLTYLPTVIRVYVTCLDMALPVLPLILCCTTRKSSNRGLHLSNMEKC